jgi:hypothetical protein
MKNLAGKIKSNPGAFEEYAEMMNSEEMKEKITTAAKNPTSPEAKEVLTLVLPFLSFGSRNMLLGEIGGSEALAQAMAMSYRFGPASTFFTLTPNDVSCPTSFRMSHKSYNNTSFPAAAGDDFLSALKDGSDFNTLPSSSSPTSAPPAGNVGHIRIPTD